MGIAENLSKLRKEIPSSVKIIAVSKNQSPERITTAYASGQRVFGENKVQEIIRKYPQLPPDIEWHFIGHLQSNKVKFIAPFIHMIHSVDSLRLLREINDQAKKHSRSIRCLLQFHIAKEETKYGLSPEEARAIIDSVELREMKNVSIDGIMGMATFTGDSGVVAAEFRSLKEIFNMLKQEFFNDSGHFRELSMGMSSDFRIAVEEGTTMVRIGSSIFSD